MHIYLIGMPGAGKSTVGKALAIHLNRPFRDLDEEIEKMAGLRIPEIFEKYGEAYFRELETEALKTVSFSGEKLIIATGGGTPCFGNNLEFMQLTGKVLYLKASPEILSDRLQLLPLESRPLLKEKSKLQLLTYLEQTFRSRAPFYEKAGIIIEPGPVAEMVATAVKVLA